MTQPSIRVLIVDRHTMVRRGTRAMLAEISDIHVVGEASSGTDAISQIEQLKPHVIVMDWKRSNAQDVHAIQQLRAQHINIRVLTLANYAEVATFLSAFQFGVQGFHIKEVDTEGLITAIRQVYHHAIFIHPSITRQLKQLEHRVALSDEQVTVLHLLSEGVSRQKILQNLEISGMELNSHIQMIGAKLG